MQSAVRAIIKAAGKLEEYEKAIKDCGTFHLKVENDPWMPLTIEVVGASEGGQPLVSVCHYREQNGDLVQDPEIVYELQDEKFIPISFQNGSNYIDNVVERNAEGKVQRAFRCSLTPTWARNLRSQSFIDAAKKVKTKTNSKEKPEPEYYIVEARHIERLRELEKSLYSEIRMDADTMRDWANWLNNSFHPDSLIEYEEK